MMFTRFTQSNNSSKDANTFAPSTCPAKNEVNSVFFTDIALAVSVLLCLFIGIINIISLICVLSILALSIMIICFGFLKRHPMLWLDIKCSTAER